MTPTAERYPAAQMVVPNILWAAFLMSQLIFAGIGWFVVSQNPPSWEGEKLVLYILAGMGVATPLIAPLVARTSARQVPPEATGVAPLFAPLVIGFALRESGALFAFVVLFLSGEAILWAVPAGVALASMLVAKPSAAGLDRLRGAGAMRRPLT